MSVFNQLNRNGTWKKGYEVDRAVIAKFLSLYTHCLAIQGIKEIGQDSVDYEFGKLKKATEELVDHFGDKSHEVFEFVIKNEDSNYPAEASEKIHKLLSFSA